MVRYLIALFAAFTLLPLLPVAAQTPTPAPTATPAPFLGGEPAPKLRGDLVMQTYSIDFYRFNGALSAEEIQALALRAEESISRGATEVGQYLTGRVSIRFEPVQQGPCAIRGITYSNDRYIRLFYAPGSDQERIVSIIAHELFHQLQHGYYGETDHRKADVILLEGMAVWGTRSYSLDANGVPAYQRATLEALAAGELLPLTTSLERDCRTGTRVNIYNEWASFVEFLLTSEGRERFDALYRSSRGRPAGSADYRAIYGRSLGQLEAEWIGWLTAQLPAQPQAGTTTPNPARR